MLFNGKNLATLMRIGSKTVAVDFSNFESGNADKTPVAYLYNGVQLPPLPDWDKTIYPYFQIHYEPSAPITKQEYYFLRCYAEQVQAFTSEYGGDYVTGTAEGVAKLTSFMYMDGVWQPFVEAVFYDHHSTDLPFYSNFDLYHQNGTLLLAATEPVPVYE